MNNTNIELQTIPERSYLYNLKPIGIGTPYVECLTSYMTRLANAHHTSSHELVTKMLKSIGINHKPLYPMINSLGEWATRFATILENWTQQKSLIFLTMAPFNNVIPKTYLCERHKKWCPECFNEWKNNELVLYEPLLWMLQDTKVCPVHKTILNQYCPNCNKKVSVLHPKSEIGFCPLCEAWLGDRILNTTAAILEEDLAHYLNFAINIGLFLESMPTRIKPLDRDNIIKAIQAIINKKCSGNITKFADSFNIPRTTACAWGRKKDMSYPSLAEQLRLCMNAGIPFLNFLEGDIGEYLSQESRENKVQRIYPKKPTYKKYDIALMGKKIKGYY